MNTYILTYKVYWYLQLKQLDWCVPVGEDCQDILKVYYNIKQWEYYDFCVREKEN